MCNSVESDGSDINQEERMAEFKIVFSNKTYGEEWFEDIKESNPEQYAVINAIIEVIKDNEGGDISQAEVFEKDSAAEDYVRRNNYKIIPANGMMLEHNGAGIRHAKYAPSKSVAILWENIKGTIYVTFDDHAPVRYHRAIYFLRELRAGKQAFPLKSRNTRELLGKLWEKGKRKNKGFDPRKRYYK
jgi:hypothetical protein